MDLQFINMPGYKETGQGAQESQDEGAPRAIDYSTTRVPIQDARTTKLRRTTFGKSDVTDLPDK